jgi:hypothetical protein
VLNTETLSIKPQNVRRTLPHLCPRSEEMVDLCAMDHLDHGSSVASGVVWVSLPVFVTTSDGMLDGRGGGRIRHIYVCGGVRTFVV